MLKVVKSGLETTVQDFPGRVGLWAQGVSPAGPLDAESFQIANQLVGNQSDAAGLEIQFVGPKLEAQEDIIFCVCGADNAPKLNDEPLALWTTHAAGRGDVLSFGFAAVASRTYLAFAGGIDVPVVMGSRSTHVASGLGGFHGRALRDGDELALGKPRGIAQRLIGATLDRKRIPEFSNTWKVRVMAGPYDDYVSEEDTALFFKTAWKVSAKSNRIGYRLESNVNFEFSEKAHAERLGDESSPSNILDYGCPIGAINICGQTPVVLLVDGPSSTGYISPFTVIASDIRKIGQSRPGDVIRFELVGKSFGDQSRP